MESDTKTIFESILESIDLKNITNDALLSICNSQGLGVSYPAREVLCKAVAAHKAGQIARARRLLERVPSIERTAANMASMSDAYLAEVLAHGVSADVPSVGTGYCRDACCPPSTGSNEITQK